MTTEFDFREKPAGFDQGFYDMTFEQYATISALNSSKLKHFRKTPAHFYSAMTEPAPPMSAQKARSLAMGKAFDLYVLEGGLSAIHRKMAIESADANRRTKEYKEWVAGQNGKTIIAPDLLTSAVRMASCAQAKQRFSDLFGAGRPHLSMIWQCRETGLWCKGEIDWLTDDGVLVDLKSTADCGFWFFNRTARRLGYVNQLAHYLDGLTTITGAVHRKAKLAAVETAPPFESIVYNVPESIIFEAEDENSERKAQLLRCLETNTWPGYPDLEMDLDSGIFDDLNYEEMEDGDDERF